MHSKKYKPALYELIGKGQIKPSTKGGLKTPDWFYTGESKSAVTDSEIKDSTAEPVVKKPLAERFRPKLTMPNFTARLKERRLEISTNFWILSLVGLALILTHSVSFMLGQRNVANSHAENPVIAAAAPGFDAGSRPAQDTLASVMQTAIRPDIYPARKPSALVKETLIPAVKSEQPAHRNAMAIDSSGMTEQRASRSASTQKSTGGMCLIICGHPNSMRELRPVQAYFNKNGLPVEIGSFQGRYVVYTQLNFDKQNSREANMLREMVVKIGRNYNSKKPKGALGFGENTFAGAYAANIDRIKNVDS